MPDPIVGVVVPTKNSARTLEACLASIASQSYPHIVTIVVDNSSTDDTPTIAKRAGVRLLMQGPERSTQRNVGAREIASDHLLFIDSDMVLGREVVEQCVHAAERGYDLLVVPERSFGEGFWARCKALEKECYIGDPDVEAARFFRRSVFERMGGYDESIAGGGEDWDLPMRATKSGCRLGRIDESIRHDEGRLKLIASAKKKMYYAKTLPRFTAKHPDARRRLLVPWRRAFFRNGRLLARHPIQTLGLLVLKSVEFAAGGIGYVIGRRRLRSAR